MKRSSSPTHSFSREFKHLDWSAIEARIYHTDERRVRQALDAPIRRSWEDFLALISPAAAPFLEEMAVKSRQLTQQRFGNTIQLYIPLYLSNECQNICTYCGFSLDNRIPRLTLTDEQIMDEVAIIKSFGYDHILLVTGEANRTVGVDYLENAIRLIRSYFSHISMEVQPLEQEEYERLIRSGLNTVLVYQETYHSGNYSTYHPKGRKANFQYRLDTPDRLGRAGIHKIGLGVLIGLEDWRTDSAFCARHLQYLEQRFWQTRFSISFPRLRPAEGYLEPRSVMSDRELVQLICAYRLFNENVELSLSTRETERFRDHAIKLGITSMSAGSRTDPGGYSHQQETLEQFQVDDSRSPMEIADMIRTQGYEPVWKDWDLVMG